MKTSFAEKWEAVANVLRDENALEEASRAEEVKQALEDCLVLDGVRERGAFLPATRQKNSRQHSNGSA